MRTTLNPRTFKKTPLSFSCFIVRPTASFTSWVCSPDHTGGMGSLYIIWSLSTLHCPFTSYIKEVKSMQRWQMMVSVYNNIDERCCVGVLMGRGHISPLSLKTKQPPTWQQARTGTQPVFKLSQEKGVAAVDPGEKSTLHLTHLLSHKFMKLSIFRHWFWSRVA